jgi:hypothetical protein
MRGHYFLEIRDASRGRSIFHLQPPHLIQTFGKTVFGPSVRTGSSSSIRPPSPSRPLGRRYPILRFGRAWDCFIADLSHGYLVVTECNRSCAMKNVSRRSLLIKIYSKLTYMRTQSHRILVPIHIHILSNRYHGSNLNTPPGDDETARPGGLQRG